MDKSDFHIIDNLSTAVHAFTSHLLISFSTDETLLLRYVNLFTSFREQPFSVEMSLFWLQHMYSVLSALTWRPMLPAVCSRLCSSDSAWIGIFTRSTVIFVICVYNSLCGVINFFKNIFKMLLLIKTCVMPIFFMLTLLPWNIFCKVVFIS